MPETRASVKHQYLDTFWDIRWKLSCRGHRLYCLRDASPEIAQLAEEIHFVASKNLAPQYKSHTTPYAD